MEWGYKAKTCLGMNSSLQFAMNNAESTWLILFVSNSFPIEVLYDPIPQGVMKIWHGNVETTKSRNFNVDLLYFQYPFKYRIIKFLIWKLLDMANMRLEGSLVAAFLASDRTSWKVTIYHIRPCRFFHHKPLYLWLKVRILGLYNALEIDWTLKPKIDRLFGWILIVLSDTYTASLLNNLTFVHNLDMKWQKL